MFFFSCMWAVKLSKGREFVEMEILAAQRASKEERREVLTPRRT